LVFGLILQKTDLDMLGSRNKLQLSLFLFCLFLIICCWFLATGGVLPVVPVQTLSGIEF